MANESAGGPFSVKGAWLTPWRNGFFVSAERVFLSAGSPRVTHEVEAEEFTIVGRDETITQGSGIVRLDVGVLEGTLSTGFGKDHHAWLTALKNLVKNQGDFSALWMQTPNRMYMNVRLGTWDDSFAVLGAGSFNVSIPFREKRS